MLSSRPSSPSGCRPCGGGSNRAWHFSARCSSQPCASRASCLVAIWLGDHRPEQLSPGRSEPQGRVARLGARTAPAIRGGRLAPHAAHGHRRLCADVGAALHLVGRGSASRTNGRLPPRRRIRAARPAARLHHLGGSQASSGRASRLRHRARRRAPGAVRPPSPPPLLR